MQVKPSQAQVILVKLLQAKLSVMLSGSPGIGKSSIVQGVADEYNLKVIDLRLAQSDPTDLLGFPTIDPITGRAGYSPMNTFPIEGDAIPEGYAGWLIFLDEFSSAPPAVQAAAYKLVLDRMVGLHHLHKNVAIICAGNKETDNAIVHPMSTALQSRMVHLELVVHPEEWMAWAAAKGIDYRITSYINFKPGNLYSFKADHTDDTYACPRTWEFADRILKVMEEGSVNLLPMLAGTLSEGVAREFLGFCKIHKELPTITQIMSTPDSIKVPDEPSILFALTGAIGHNASADNFTQLSKFIKRLPVEFQVVTLRETLRRNKPLLAHAAMQDWISSSAVSLF